MLKLKYILGLLLLLPVGMVMSLECTGNQVKVTVKIPDPKEFDVNEQYLFKGMLAYSLRVFCASNPNGRCTSTTYDNYMTIDTVHVEISNVTNRFAMCVSIADSDEVLLQDAIKESKPRFNGALVLTDDTLVVEGIPPTLTPEVVPDFPTWLIPFIVFFVLIVLTAVAIIGYTVYQSKKAPKEAEKESLSVQSDNIYENPGALTML